MQKLFVSILLVLVSFSLNTRADQLDVPEKIEGASNLSAEQVVQLILQHPQLVIIDSRKKREYLKGHIEGAINMLNTDMSRESLAAISDGPESILLFYCNGQRCLRSSDAVRKALSWNYKNIYWFRGGWQEWTDKRLPVITK